METIVLDYSDGVVHIIRHKKSTQSKDMESFLCTKYDFRLDEIEWMSAEKLEFIYQDEEPQEKTQFTIDEDEILVAVGKKLTKSQMKEILTFIENDEGIWKAIERAKQDAIDYVFKKV